MFKIVAAEKILTKAKDINRLNLIVENPEELPPHQIVGTYLAIWTRELSEKFTDHQEWEMRYQHRITTLEEQLQQAKKELRQYWEEGYLLGATAAATVRSGQAFNRLTSALEDMESYMEELWD